MEIKNRLRNDLWKAVHAHYEGKDYTGRYCERR